MPIYLFGKMLCKLESVSHFVLCCPLGLDPNSHGLALLALKLDRDKELLLEQLLEDVWSHRPEVRLLLV